jgi:hypothetical protein
VPGVLLGVHPEVDRESIQRADPLLRFACYRRTVRLLQIVEVTPHVRLILSTR